MENKVKRYLGLLIFAASMFFLTANAQTSNFVIRNTGYEDIKCNLSESVPANSCPLDQPDCFDMRELRAYVCQFKSEYDRNPSADNLSRYQNILNRYYSNLGCFTNWYAAEFRNMPYESSPHGFPACLANFSQSFDPISATEKFMCPWKNHPDDGGCIYRVARRTKITCPPLSPQIWVGVNNEKIAARDQFTVSWKLINAPSPALPDGSCSYPGTASGDNNPQTTCTISSLKTPDGKPVHDGTTFAGSKTYTFVTTGIYKFTYTCTGFSDNSKNTARAPVSRDVLVFVGPIPPSPKVNSFNFVTPDENLENISGGSSATDLKYQVEVGKPFKLKWDVSNISTESDARSITVFKRRGGAETVVASTNTANNSAKPLEIKPDITGIYLFRIEVKNEKYPELGTDSMDLKLRVYDVTNPQAMNVQFSATKEEIIIGESTTLNWSAVEASKATLDHDIGEVSTVGSTDIAPIVTTTYNLTATSPLKDVPPSHKSVTITVKSKLSADKITNEKDCLAAGYFWYGNACHAMPEEPIVPVAEEFEQQPGSPAEQKTDLKVNGSDGPVTLKAPATFKLSWNLDSYCLATGSWLDVKLKSGNQDMTVKKNGKYTYTLYCPGFGTDSVEVNVAGGTGSNANTGLLDSLSGKNTDELSGAPLPVAQASLSTDKINYSSDIKVVKGKSTDIYIKAEGSSDETGSWSDLMANGGRCLFNTKLIKGTPQFDGMIESPLSPAACNAKLGTYTFNDEPGTYQYGILKLQQSDDKFSNIAYVNITVENPPPQTSAPVIDFRINGNAASEQLLGTPANFTLTWNVTNSDTCAASGSWTGSKSLSGIQNFVSSSRKEFSYTLTCEGKLGTTSKTIELRVIESPSCSFTALPPTISKQSAFVTESELSWKCDYSDECSIDPVIDAQVKTYGSARVSPSQTATYTLTCINSATSKSFEAEVGVEL